MRNENTRSADLSGVIADLPEAASSPSLDSCAVPAPAPAPAVETIFALSSAPGRAGVAVVRVSGPAAGRALAALIGYRPPPRQARLATLRGSGGEAIDRALVLWFPAPRSFTGEDVAEFHIHGGRAVVAAVTAALAAVPGLRPAEAGEFARRAFDNGKLDLAEIEGLADLIAAETEAQRRQALRQMDGALSRQIAAWRARLVASLGRLEAAIDFVDEDLPADLVIGVAGDIAALRDDIAAGLEDGRCAERLRGGLWVAIVGAPNVGKSSLINALAQRDVAIVSDVPGTTRDAIEVHLDLGGYPVTVVDTAGLRALLGADESSAHGALEREGMRRARARAAAADLILALFDLRDAPTFDPATLALVDGRTLVVLNKADLTTRPGPATVAGRPAVAISARTGAGLDELIARIQQTAAAALDSGAPAPITRARHRRALEECLDALTRAERICLATGSELELAAEDLRLAGRALGRIAGRVDVEDVLDSIFREFCIGK
ncbi:MAG: tRNA uridine-5-carboxymethylaminomethyl(34) synthesis GTPase MnmE [Alphaproteobacteria bacterium]|nr:MAG: tRNA uridine-5-carboxymethylaminomethyl(34) synthesis GTPase MnmE [Alphaproteobacteria bacterium]